MRQELRNETIPAGERKLKPRIYDAQRAERTRVRQLAEGQ